MELKYIIAEEVLWIQSVLLKNNRIDLMIAYLLTKSLQPKTFKQQVQIMSLSCTYD